MICNSMTCMFPATPRNDAHVPVCHLVNTERLVGGGGVVPPPPLPPPPPPPGPPLAAGACATGGTVIAAALILFEELAAASFEAAGATPDFVHDANENVAIVKNRKDFFISFEFLK